MEDRKYISFKDAEEMEAFAKLNRERIDAERSARLKSIVGESIDTIKAAERRGAESRAKEIAKTLEQIYWSNKYNLLKFADEVAKYSHFLETGEKLSQKPD